MKAYYNEIDPEAAAWIRELIKGGHIAPGDVDERSILDVRGDDLVGYAQCHFFAGIGGWSFALRLAGVPDDRPIWTGSCPCQSLSSAGLRKGHADKRHLWPAFYELIAERRPATVLGEQVASADGREWLAGIRADLEGLGHACGAADLCAAGVGAPNIRQRLYWVADADRDRLDQVGRRVGAAGRDGVVGNDGPGRLEHAERPGLEGHAGSETHGSAATAGAGETSLPAESNFWSLFDLLPCADGKARRIEPGSFPLAHGLPARVGRLRGYGNAINPVLAARFIQACGII